MINTDHLPATPGFFLLIFFLLALLDDILNSKCFGTKGEMPFYSEKIDQFIFEKETKSI